MFFNIHIVSHLRCGACTRGFRDIVVCDETIQRCRVDGGVCPCVANEDGELQRMAEIHTRRRSKRAQLRFTNQALHSQVIVWAYCSLQPGKSEQRVRANSKKNTTEDVLTLTTWMVSPNLQLRCGRFGEP